MRGVDPGRVPRSEGEMARKAQSQSSDIMSRLQATGLLPALEAAKVAPKKRVARREGSGTRSGRYVGTNGMGIYGRRVMSHWQAQALGSGRGVVVNPEKMTWTDSPQHTLSGWGRSYDVSSGRDAIVQGQLSGAVHIAFPEWVR